MLPKVPNTAIYDWKPKPCWEREWIEAIASRQMEWSILDVLRLQEVSAEDRLWVVLRPELCPVPVAVAFSAVCADRAKQHAAAAATAAAHDAAHYAHYATRAADLADLADAAAHACASHACASHAAAAAGYLADLALAAAAVAVASAAVALAAERAIQIDTLRALLKAKP